MYSITQAKRTIVII